jgi:hypothetical protein
MNSLSEWFRQLPPEARTKPSDLGKEFKRESVSLYLYYYQCINMTARPLLLYAVRRQMAANAQRPTTTTTRWEDGLPADMVSVIHAAIAAARSSTSILKDAAQYNLVGRFEFNFHVSNQHSIHAHHHPIATYGFIDGEQAFSAALLLVMVNIAFPYKEMDASAMNTSLQVLQGMAEGGNRYIRACHSLLTKIRDTIKPKISPTGPGGADGSDGSEHEHERQPGHAVYHIPQDKETSPTGLMAVAIATPPAQDPAWPVDMGDDLGLWSEVLDSIGIDMDRHWIETALMAEENLNNESM